MISQALWNMRRFVVACWHFPVTFARWARRSYPRWSPQTGHVALVALCGRDESLIEQTPSARLAR